MIMFDPSTILEKGKLYQVKHIIGYHYSNICMYLFSREMVNIDEDPGNIHIQPTVGYLEYGEIFLLLDWRSGPGTQFFKLNPALQDNRAMAVVIRVLTRAGIIGECRIDYSLLQNRLITKC